MMTSRVAQRYAKAVMQIAHEQNAFDAVVEDFKTLSAAIANSLDLRNLLASPVIDERTKEKILREIFAGKLSQETERFMTLMTLKGRAAELPSIVSAFETLLDVERNIVPAKITTAVELSDEQRQQVERRLAAMSGRTIRATYLVDSALIGGFRARFEDTMIDASVRHQLEQMHEALVQGSNN